MPYLALLPLLGMLFDYLENISIVILLSYYPQKIVGVAYFGGVATFCKWIFLFSGMGVILVGLIAWAVSGLRKR